MKGHIPWRHVDAQLHALRSLWVSTTRPDGRPHAVPVWFAWYSHAPYVATHEVSQRVPCSIVCAQCIS
jgi:hypothetical protein